MTFQVIPAIDLRDGCVVRLRQGDYARQTAYSNAPHELAVRYAAAGAQWLHVVDLDGARSGCLDNLAVIETMVKAGIRIQAGGGVRDKDNLHRLYAVGVNRVVLGSIAIREPERVVDWLAEFGSDRLTIALDTRFQEGRWTLPSTGWTQTEAHTLDELAPWYARHGALHLLCTDIARDGMFAGFNLDLYRYLDRTVPQLAVQASGGARSLEDIRAARKAGARGVILGRALLEQRFTIEEALAC